MAEEIILVDTSILIDFYRKTDKNNSLWVKLVRQGYGFAISAITKYEICSGATSNQFELWDAIFHEVKVAIDKAVEINSILKHKRKQIGIADLFIAATAISNNFSFSTLNRKHFDRVENLKILD